MRDIISPTLASVIPVPLRSTPLGDQQRRCIVGCMSDYVCQQCGGILEVGFRSMSSNAMPGMTGVDVAGCPSCGRALSESELDEVQTNSATGRILAVTPHNAARMLGRPGDDKWVHEQFSGEFKGHQGAPYVPIRAVREYAETYDIAVTPLGPNLHAIWI